MTIAELNELIITKLGIKPWKHYDESFAVRFHHHGNTYRVTTDLNVEKVDGACLVTDSDAQQLEKLLRGEQWGGTGLPPVGTECEVSRITEWSKARISYVSVNHVVFSVIYPDGDEEELCWATRECRFRLLRTERDKAVEQMLTIIDCHPLNSAAAIYDAILAGKIDGLGKVG